MAGSSHHPNEMIAAGMFDDSIDRCPPTPLKLTLTGGSFSTYIQSLKLGKLLKYEYVPEFQAALYSPKSL